MHIRPSASLGGASSIITLATNQLRPQLVGKAIPRNANFQQPHRFAMTAFSDPDFDFKRYQASRPRYPELVYKTVLDFHHGNHDTALDIGCGPGLSLFPLAFHFKHLVGCDPSNGMIEQGRQAWNAWKNSLDEAERKKLVSHDAAFHTNSAENLSNIEDQSVDLITAATAAHWFDFGPLWIELARVLKPRGTAAFWTYGENYLPAHPSLKPIMSYFMSSKSEGLGPYWPQPGRGILEGLLTDVPFPAKAEEVHWDMDSAVRKHHKMSTKGIADISWTRKEAPEETFRMEHIMSFDQLNNYFHTSSASAAYFKKFPEKAAEKPDMIDRLCVELKERVLAERRDKTATFEDGLDDEHVRVAWPLGMMMIRRKAA